FTHTETTLTDTLSLHDALPIFDGDRAQAGGAVWHSALLLDLFESEGGGGFGQGAGGVGGDSEILEPADGAGRGGNRIEQEHGERSEEHTSELQSRENLVCRLLL